MEVSPSPARGWPRFRPLEGRQRTVLSRVTGTPHRQPELPGSPPGRPHPRRNATVRPTPRPSGCRAARTRARSRRPRRRRGAFDLAAGNFMLGRLPLCFDQNPLNGVCHGLPPVIGSADVSVGLSSEFPANPCGNGPARRIVRWTAAPALGGHFPYFRPLTPRESYPLSRPYLLVAPRIALCGIGAHQLCGLDTALMPAGRTRELRARNCSRRVGTAALTHTDVDDQDLYTIVITTYIPPRQVGDGPWTPWYADYYHPAV